MQDSDNAKVRVVSEEDGMVNSLTGIYMFIVCTEKCRVTRNNTCIQVGTNQIRWRGGTGIYNGKLNESGTQDGSRVKMAPTLLRASATSCLHASASVFPRSIDRQAKWMDGWIDGWIDKGTDRQTDRWDRCSLLFFLLLMLAHRKRHRHVTWAQKGTAI